MPAPAALAYPLLTASVCVNSCAKLPASADAKRTSTSRAIVETRLPAPLARPYTARSRMARRQGHADLNPNRRAGLFSAVSRVPQTHQLGTLQSTRTRFVALSERDTSSLWRARCRRRCIRARKGRRGRKYHTATIWELAAWYAAGADQPRERARVSDTKRLRRPPRCALLRADHSRRGSRGAKYRALWGRRTGVPAASHAPES